MASIFSGPQPVTQAGTCRRICRNLMEQQLLPLIGRLDGPSVVDPQVIALCATYRDAVRLMWDLRRVKGVTKSMLAAECGLYKSHVTDYFHADDEQHRRDLPAKYLPIVESYLGNTAVTQWLASASKLTVMEELQLFRRTA